ncbi:hypothetical protein C3L33_23479, partial [Rhododendron williamsianum]
MSTPTALSSTIFPYLRPVLSHYAGGDRILNNDNNISSEFSLESEKYFRFYLTQNIFETNTSGVHKIEAELYFPGNHRRSHSLRFGFHGLWSRYSGKLCM